MGFIGEHLFFQFVSGVTSMEFLFTSSHCVLLKTDISETQATVRHTSRGRRGSAGLKLFSISYQISAVETS